MNARMRFPMGGQVGTLCHGHQSTGGTSEEAGLVQLLEKRQPPTWTQKTKMNNKYEQHRENSKRERETNTIIIIEIQI